MKTVAFYTLGCKVNQYETQAMSELFQKNGYEVVDPSERADVYVINTCTVTNLGDRKSRQFIRRSKKKNQDAIIGVVGCYSQISPNEVLEIEGVDIILGTKDRSKIVELCEKVREEHKKINLVEDIMQVREFEELAIEEVKGKTRANLKIQEGCNQYCSYCIIPYARGLIRSRKLENIIAEVKKLAKNGFKEIVLTGIHVASYGKDLGEIRLIDVLEAIHGIDGIERIRLSSLEPTLVTEEFMTRLTKLSKVCDHFHLSLQSGCDSVLKRMNRKYTTGEYKEIVNIIRKYMPNVAITTDIIVGFPGETEEEFKKTYEFVKDIKFTKIHVFKYSPRTGTPAAKYKNQIDGNIKNERSHVLIELGERLTNEFISNLIGETVEVLFEDNSNDEKGYIEGYTTNYIKTLAKGDDREKETIQKVKVNGVDDENILGEIIK
ncbi:tRNA (N(6)-L-threonylcarbamoyladenosine(37)-C(2))-methylthiotransferase MtaB [Sporosalibacterium faouarense]|uniref:tRNA (N(6)-L-threonylcarbamoyladenosine(37)-C(2))- methylthiotransferase MtaB n=1 Tax=Sporosalibacterium faouarense TaxID=516123 RepID=UPI00192BEF64|nr:tRNA (N(6)-L-threonylcarbamoyladenosine(37)-C(2))-methylthiotransferase MtaB [Sporosalibacterium faouarense]